MMRHVHILVYRFRRLHFGQGTINKVGDCLLLLSWILFFIKDEDTLSVQTSQDSLLEGEEVAIWALADSWRQVSFLIIVLFIQKHFRCFPAFSFLDVTMPPLKYVHCLDKVNVHFDKYNTPIALSKGSFQNAFRDLRT